MKTYLQLALLLFTYWLPAQEVQLFEDTQTQTLVYRSSHLSGPSAPALQQILRCLERPHPNQASSFNLTYSYQLRILERPEALKVCINWESLFAEGSTQPLGFAFDDVLLPDGATYNLELLADGEVVKSECIRQEFGQPLPSYIYDFTEVEGGVYYTMRVNELHFEYGSRQVLAVQNRKKTIDQYLTAKTDLVGLHHELDQFRQLDPIPQQLNNYRQRLNNYQNELNGMANAPFWSLLKLNRPNAYDPEDVGRLLTDCQADIASLQDWLDDLQANLHILHFDQGLALYQNGNTRAAREAFCASLQSNDRYAPSHYFIAYIDFADGKIDDAAQRIRKVLNRYNPDPNIREDARHLASGIVRFYLDAGQDAVALRQYPEGVAFYQEALGFSQSINAYDFGQAEAISRIKEAYYLDFHDRLDQVVYTQETGQHALALEQLEAATAFQREFNVSSTADTRGLAQQIVNSLYDDQITAIQQQRRAGNWEEALKAIRSTEQLIADYPGMVRQPLQLESEKKQILTGKFQAMITQIDQLLSQKKLDQALSEANDLKHFALDYELEASMLRESERQIVRVQQLRYERFIRGGDHARSNTQYAEALEQYDRAKQLGQEIERLQTNVALDQKIQNTALLEAKKLFNNTMATAAQNNDQIRATGNQLQQLAQRYRIHQDAQFIQLINQLDDQLCTNARDLLLPQQEQQLTRQQQARDFIAARKTLNSIQALLDTYPDCALSEASILMNQSVVEACARYQETLNAAETAESQQQFGRAIEHYVAAAAAYQHASAQARLAGHPAFRLNQYLSTHPSYRMQMAGAHYYLDQRQHDDALALLRLVVGQGVHPKTTEGLQARMGSALAARHHVSSAHWKTTFYGLIAKSERKPYKALYRSFRKQWKRMA